MIETIVILLILINLAKRDLRIKIKITNPIIKPGKIIVIAIILSFVINSMILANIASILFFLLTNQQVSMVGASGAIYGVLLAFGGYYPEVTLLLFFVIPMKAKWAILLMAVLMRI